MVVYDSAVNYLGTCTGLKAKIVAIDAIISALELMALSAAEKGDLSEYSLDDGQTKIKTVYRNVTDITASINGFETIKQRYINQLTGRRTRLVDSKNFLR